MIQWSMRPTRKYLIVASLFALVAAAALFARTGTAADTLRIYDWAAAPAPYEQTGVPQSGMAPILNEDRYYTPVVAGAVPGRSDKLPIAILGTHPQGITDVGIHVTPTVQSLPPNTFLHLLASVRYRLNGQAVYLTTSEPVSLDKEEALNIGRLRETTGSGRAIYIASTGVWTGTPEKLITFNQVTFVENGLIVTLASELPQEELVTLIKTVGFTGR